MENNHKQHLFLGGLSKFDHDNMGRKATMRGISWNITSSKSMKGFFMDYIVSNSHTTEECDIPNSLAASRVSKISRDWLLLGSVLAVTGDSFLGIAEVFSFQKLQGGASKRDVNVGL